MNFVYVKSKTKDTVTLAGYGVVFGGKDLYWDRFTSDTDFMLDLVPAKAIFFGHALPFWGNVGDAEVSMALTHQLGHSVKETIDEKGIFIEVVLQRSEDYVNEIAELVEAHPNVLGWSSGSVGHLIDWEYSGQDDVGVFKRWPNVE